MSINFSIIIPTCGRPTLARTLDSVMTAGFAAGDEVLVVGDGPQPAARALVDAYAGRLAVRYLETPARTNSSGDEERNLAMPLAKGSHLLFQDDDDAYTKGSFATIRKAAAENPGRILMFKMRAANTERHRWGVLWHFRDPFVGNISTQMFCIPNVPERLGIWKGRPNGMGAGDFIFLAETLHNWPGGKESIVWREEVICDRY